MVVIMSDTRTIIRDKNTEFLKKFEDSLKESGLSSKTIKNHIQNLEFFTEYLVYYEPFQALSEIDDGEVSDFLCDFFPRKAMWASASYVKQYISVFKKLFKWMVGIKLVSEDEHTSLLEAIKEQKEEWLSAVEFDEDCEY